MATSVINTSITLATSTTANLTQALPIAYTLPSYNTSTFSVSTANVDKKTTAGAFELNLYGYTSTNLFPLPVIYGTVPELVEPKTTTVASVQAAPEIKTTTIQDQITTNTFWIGDTSSSVYTIESGYLDDFHSDYIVNTATAYNTEVLGSLCLTFRDAKCPGSGQYIEVAYDYLNVTYNYLTVETTLNTTLIDIQFTLTGSNLFDIGYTHDATYIDTDNVLNTIDFYDTSVIYQTQYPNIDTFNSTGMVYDIDFVNTVAADLHTVIGSVKIYDIDLYLEVAEIDYLSPTTEVYNIYSPQASGFDGFNISTYITETQWPSVGINKFINSPIQCHETQHIEPINYCFTIEDDLYDIIGLMQEHNVFADEGRIDNYRSHSYEHNKFHLSEEPIRIGRLVQGTQMTYNILNRRYTIER